MAAPLFLVLSALFSPSEAAAGLYGMGSIEIEADGNVRSKMMTRSRKAAVAVQSEPTGEEKDWHNLKEAGQAPSVGMLQKTVESRSDCNDPQRPAPPPFPASLVGRNLLIAGDSNDRGLANFLCTSYNSTWYGDVNGDHQDHEFYTSVTIGGSNVAAIIGRALNLTLAPDTKVEFEFPPEAVMYTCHLREYNASVMSFFHYGIMGMDPEPEWHSSGISGGRLSHWPSVSVPDHPTTQLALAPDELVSIVWPAAVDMHLPQRPAIFLTQSSLWDTIVFSDRQMNLANGDPDDAFIKQAEQEFPSWDWQARASKYIQAARSSPIPFERILWRTNPDCAGDSGEKYATLLRDLHSFQHSCVRDAIKKAEAPWQDVRLVDWQAHWPVKDKSQCNADGVHYPEAAVRAYVEAIFAVV